MVRAASSILQTVWKANFLFKGLFTYQMRFFTSINHLFLIVLKNIWCQQLYHKKIASQLGTRTFSHRPPSNCAKTWTKRRTSSFMSKIDGIIFNFVIFVRFLSLQSKVWQISRNFVGLVEVFLFYSEFCVILSGTQSFSRFFDNLKKNVTFSQNFVISHWKTQYYFKSLCFGLIFFAKNFLLILLFLACKHHCCRTGRIWIVSCITCTFMHFRPTMCLLCLFILLYSFDFFHFFYL